MTSRDTAVAHIENYVESGDFLTDITRLVAHETESQKPESLPALHTYLDEEIAPMLHEMGFTVEKCDNPLPDEGPLLIGTRIEDSALPTILIYGHGDVVRGQANQWREGLSPFTVSVEGDHIYGRGSADNKSQHLINFRALRAVLVERGSLGFNTKVIIEMGEENGSPGLRDFFAANCDKLSADVLIASDGPRLQPDKPTIFMGSRGAMNFDLRVDLREGAHHSGNFGGLLADPAIILAHALASITDARGQICIPNWRPTSLTPAIREAVEELPIGGVGPEINEDWGEESLTPAERVFGWNSFAVLAMKSGVPEAPVNAISGQAYASCQLRFVVGTEPDRILPALREHLDKYGFDAVRIVADDRAMFHATRLSPDHPWVRFAAKSLETTTGFAPHILPNLAGSLPNECFTEVLGLPTIWIPHSYAGCSQHAPNEHILRSVIQDALRCMVGLFWDLGELESIT
jgi:acetylornithine deacetylase/succinyl-diaminopimelate desuccinylase-like protein